MKYQFVSLYVTILLLSSYSNLSSQSISEVADKYLEEIVTLHSIPGVSAGIALNGEIVWTGAAGHRDLESGKKVDKKTVFRSASISKAITATAIMQLVEKGMIKLDAPIQDYLSDYPAPKKDEMTTLHLLSHTSGIRHYKGNESRSFDHHDNLREACRVFEGRRLAFTPGKKRRYTSYGYTVLGAIIEAVSGQTFGDYLTDNIFVPSDMDHSMLDNPHDASINQSKLYEMKKGKISEDVYNDLSNIYPAGGINMTAEDLLRFVIHFENGCLISDESKESMLTAPTFGGKILDEHGALGWDIWEVEAYGRGYHKVGGQSGTSALVIHYRDLDLTIAFLSNMARLDPIWEIIGSLRDIALNR